jgi:hypothetical protein
MVPHDQSATPIWDIFLSHARTNGQLSRENKLIREALLRRRPRLRVFLDSESIDSSELWLTALDQAQRSSRATVILVSNTTGSSPWQLAEIVTAIELYKGSAGAHRVFPIRWNGDIPWPAGLVIFQGVTVSDEGGVEPAIDKLLQVSGPGRRVKRAQRPDFRYELFPAPTYGSEDCAEFIPFHIE